MDDDLVSVVLRDTLTKGERSLVEDDQAQLVLEMRKAYQQTMRDDLIAGIEQITGRNVIAFLKRQLHQPRHRRRELRARAPPTRRKRYQRPAAAAACLIAPAQAAVLAARHRQGRS